MNLMMHERCIMCDNRRHARYIAVVVRSDSNGRNVEISFSLVCMHGLPLIRVQVDDY